EAWGYSPTTAARPGEVGLTRTYPDRAHGSAAILGPPVDTKLVQVQVRSGRWLMPGDTDGAVLTHRGTAMAPGTRVGDVVSLSCCARRTGGRVAGTAEDFAPPPAAYVTDKAFARAAATGDRAQLLRIATTAESADVRNATLRRIEDELVRAG